MTHHQTRLEQAPVPRCGAAALSAAIAALTAAFGNRVVTSRAVREQHAHTTTWIANEPPDAVVFPQSTADVQAIVAHLRRASACRSSRSAPAPRSKARSTRRAAASRSTCRDMNRVLAVHAEDLDCVVEPGVTRKQLNEHLRDQGLFFPIDPGADASPRRHGGDARLRHQCGALRHDAGQRALADGRARRTASVMTTGGAREEVVRRLRSDPAVRRLGGHARRHHRADAEAARHPGGDRRRRLPVPERRGGLQRGDRDDPDRHSGRAHRAARRAAGEGDERLFEARLCPKSRCCSSSSTAREAGVAEQARALRRDRRRVRRRAVRVGDARGGAHAAVEGAARRLLGGGRAAARREGLRHRCLRADLAARRMHRRDAGATSPRAGLIAPIVGHVGDGNFHLLAADRHGRPGRDRARARRFVAAARRAGARDGRHLHRRARHRAGQDEVSRSANSARRPSTSCARSSARSTRTIIMNPGKVVACL